MVMGVQVARCRLPSALHLRQGEAKDCCALCQASSWSLQVRRWLTIASSRLLRSLRSLAAAEARAVDRTSDVKSWRENSQVVFFMAMASWW